jgi:hypothetical protein
LRPTARRQGACPREEAEAVWASTRGWWRWKRRVREEEEEWARGKWPQKSSPEEVPSKARSSFS